MKLSPKIYAQTLIDSAKTDNLKEIASGFWYALQKNKQYKDLPKIMESLDEEAAKKENKILAKVYSKNALNLQEQETLIEKLQKKLNKQIILKNFIGKNVTGIVVKVDDQIIDMTVENKINRLKKVISSN